MATVAVLLDMDPDDLNNLGAMRNAFWTSMSVNTGGSNGPADPDMAVEARRLQPRSRHRRAYRLGEWAEGIARPQHAIVEAHRAVIRSNRNDLQ